MRKSSTQYSLFNSESIWLKLSKIKNINNFILGVIYRHLTTTNVGKLLDDLSSCLTLTDLLASKKTFYLIGDMNIDLTPSKRAKLACDYLNIIVSNGTLPLNTLPTRVSSNSATIIGRILSNNLKNKLTSLVFRNDVTDHYLIICSIKKRKSFSTKINQSRFFKDKFKFDSREFCSDLHLNLYNFYQNLPALAIIYSNNLFNDFAKLILEIINKLVPLKSASSRQKRLSSKPWISRKILFSKRKRRCLNLIFK